LRHCVTGQKVVGSIPGVAIGIFQLHNPGHPTALWMTACNRNKYQEYFLGVKAAGAYG